MANDFFNHSVNRIVAGTTARAADVNNIADEIATGLDKMPTEQQIKEDTIQYVAATGAADAYVVTSTYPRTAYTAGMKIVFKVPAGAANTGACTVDVDGLGAKSFKRADGTNPAAGDLPAGGLIEARYDGTNFILMQYPATDAASAAADAAAAAASAAAALASETAAGLSETAAAASETAAGVSETNAAASEAAALAYRDTASTHATTATTQAGIATTQAGLAATSESNAASSASTATTQAGIATTQAGNAATSASNAATSEANAAASYDAFDDRYLGAKASDPTLDNDGDPLIDGAIYFNTTSNEMRVYDLGNTTWIAFSTQALPRREHFTATAGQTTFSVAGGYTPGYIDVYLNGIKLKNADDVTVTSGTDIVLISGAQEGDDVSVVAYTTVGLIDNAFTGDLSATGDFTATNITASGTVSAVHPTNKNVVTGGDFMTNPWQRGTSSTPTVSSAVYTADRWQSVSGLATGRWTHRLGTAGDTPAAADSGVFTDYCYEMAASVAEGSPAAGAYNFLMQSFEGIQVGRFGFGEPGTRYVTLSFWHRHTKTGTYSASLRNGAANRSYIAEYTQSVSDTWEKAEITIPVDTTGTWITNGTNSGLLLQLVSVAGSTYQTTAGSWAAGNYLASTNQVNGLDSLSNYMRFALIQLEAGQVATQFEARDAATELALCQRYYEAGTGVQGIGTNQSAGQSVGTWVSFAVPKRVTPTVTLSNFVNGANCSAQANGGATKNGYAHRFTIISGLTNSLGTGDFTADAEL